MPAALVRLKGLTAFRIRIEPNCLKTWKLSTEPGVQHRTEFSAERRDIVGTCLRWRTQVLAVDEKS